jgi:hypothetical protein
LGQVEVPIDIIVSHGAIPFVVGMLVEGWRSPFIQVATLPAALRGGMNEQKVGDIGDIWGGKGARKVNRTKVAFLADI